MQLIQLPLVHIEKLIRRALVSYLFRGLLTNTSTMDEQMLSCPTMQLYPHFQSKVLHSCQLEKKTTRLFSSLPHFV